MLDKVKMQLKMCSILIFTIFFFLWHVEVINEYYSLLSYRRPKDSFAALFGMYLNHTKTFNNKPK